MKAVLWLALLSTGLWVFVGCDNDDPVAGSRNPLADIPVDSSDYLNHRFFKLDLPLIEPGGRLGSDKILLETIRIFQLLPGTEPAGEDIANVATYVDSLGYRNWYDIDFESPYQIGSIWPEITSWDLLQDVGGDLVAVDLGTRMGLDEVLAVIYEVAQADGSIFKVGDIPGIDPPQQVVGGEEALQQGLPSPQQDENGLDDIRIFGLDQDDPLGNGYPDGIVDKWNPLLFDLQKGLLRFPEEFPHPFAPGGNPAGRPAEADMLAEASYAAFADTAVFAWEDTYLRGNQAWQLYDPSVDPLDYDLFAFFRIVATYARSGPG